MSSELEARLFRAEPKWTSVRLSEECGKCLSHVHSSVFCGSWSGAGEAVQMSLLIVTEF